MPHTIQNLGLQTTQHWCQQRKYVQLLFEMMFGRKLNNQSLIEMDRNNSETRITSAGEEWAGGLNFMAGCVISTYLEHQVS